MSGGSDMICSLAPGSLDRPQESTSDDSEANES